MKKFITPISIAVLMFPVLSCGSFDSGALGSVAGEAAGQISRALGVDESTASSIQRGASTAVSTAAEAVKAANSLTAENEYYLGRAVAANIAGTYTVYTGSPALQTYLNKICSTIVINSPQPDIYRGYHVAILNTQEINAFATPGGHIFVTRGLIACAGSEDALAAVIAHEVAHIQLRHALTSIRNARYVNAAVSGALAGVGEVFPSTEELADIMGESVNEVVTTLVVNGFSKRQELEADSTALSLLAAAGYQPSGILDMLESLKQNQQNEQGFFKTHPSPAERITSVNRELNKYSVPDSRSYRTARYTAAVPR
ncbi:MAG: M48 family metallopeptidase [Spirochaetaceae bacterium]|jgi:predicted Zn-dependent protease|nr:M48 family metallopeptidase [Spirochaetaceae bacterium]